MPYQVRVSSMIVFLRTGSLTLLTQSQLVTGSWTTSPVSHKPGLVVRPLLANASLLGSTYGGSRPVTRSVTSVATTRPPTASTPIFSVFVILVLPQAERIAGLSEDGQVFGVRYSVSDNAELSGPIQRSRARKSF